MTALLICGVATGLLLLIAVLARSHLFTVIVAGDSMEPGLAANEAVLCTRTWPKHWLKPGAIAVIQGYGGVRSNRSFGGHAGALLIKRVTHGPRDTVVVSALDVERVPACYAAWTSRLVRSSQGAECTLTLGETEVFVMADRRDTGLDSRSFGPVAAGA